MPVGWNPDQYRQFAEQRAQPFHDLLALVHPTALRRAVDLGCGPGEPTALALDRLGIATCVGIDDSPAMLASAAFRARPHLRFEAGDIGSWPRVAGSNRSSSAGDHDPVLVDTSLQWVPDHPAVLARWTAALAPCGQLAVRVPANASMPAHQLIQDVAASATYRGEFGAAGPPADPLAVNVPEPEHDAQLLFDLGFAEQDVRLQVCPHVLPSTHHIVEWVRGTTTTRIEKGLPPDVYARFLVDYERVLRTVLGDNEPQFFPCRRILMLGRRP